MRSLRSVRKSGISFAGEFFLSWRLSSWLLPRTAENPSARSCLRHRQESVRVSCELSASQWLNGGKLIDRSQTRFVETTEAGKEFVRFAGDVLKRTEKFLHDLHHVQYGNDIRLASIYSSWMTYGRQIEVSFTKQVPDGR